MDLKDKTIVVYVLMVRQNSGGNFVEKIHFSYTLTQYLFKTNVEQTMYHHIDSENGKVVS